MSEIVERVARAIRDVSVASPSYSAMARAAISAMPEPWRGEPVAWRWRTLPAFREHDDNGEWTLTKTAPITDNFINPHHHEVEPLYAVLPSSPARAHASDCSIYSPGQPCDCERPSSPAPATTGDIPTGSRPPAPAAMGHSSGAGEAISPEDLAEVLENVRMSVTVLKLQCHAIPIELHKACQALTHMTKDSA